jgi:hypothetical protein
MLAKTFPKNATTLVLLALRKIVCWKLFSWVINEEFNFCFLCDFPGCWFFYENVFLTLADAYGCKIVSNSDTTYTCTPDNSSPLYEVHVLGVYEVINRRPPRAGNARVNIISRGKSNRPIVLVLVSYEPVNWILINIPSDITISKVILVSKKYSKHVW